ncbi:MAG: indole-3-glycerol-phosphate synthase [Flavobacteriales bacterium]|nr:indole-3-glycerol-phosphate synthase [Flavobacteriales bacterium]
MTILDEIVAFKKVEVEKSKQSCSIEKLRGFPFYDGECFSLRDNLLGSEKVGIIAEFKRKSPSKKNINLTANLEQVVKGYEKSNVAGISVLTDSNFFGGTLNDLQKARSFVTTPLLRKDFVIDSYQLHEAKAYGADVVLLIANILTPDQTESLALEAKELGLETLLEIDSMGHIDSHIIDTIDIVGVNNRNLKTFLTSITNSLNLLDSIPDQFARISESGIHTISDARQLLNSGFNGLLMGQKFMQEENTVQACQDFIQELNHAIYEG